MLRLLSGTSSWVAYHRPKLESLLMKMMIVVGQDELETESVNIRNRDDEVQGREEVVDLKEAVSKLVMLKESKAAVSKL